MRRIQIFIVVFAALAAMCFTFNTHTALAALISQIASESEGDVYCAWKDSKGDYHCVKGTQSNVTCSDIESPEQCKTPNKCVRKTLTLGECIGTEPLGSQTRPTPEEPKDLGKLIQQLFNWSLGILGVTVFVIIIFSGAQMILYAGVPGKISDAQDRIRDAILGAALLLAAYLILNVINPNLVKQNTTLPPIKSGTSSGGTK